MKVLHIFKTYFPDTQGGLEEAIRQISKYTTSQGVENRILTVSDNPIPQRIKYPEAEVIRYKKTIDIFSTPISKNFFFDCEQEIKTCDILHFHFPWPFAEMLFLYKRFAKPSIVTYHADALKYKWIKFFFKPVIHKYLGQVDKIVATSQPFLDSSQDLQSFKDKCSVINLSIDDNRFRLSDNDKCEQGSVIKKIESKYGREFFLFVGVLRHYKGLEYLIKAMSRLENNLVIIGKGENKGKLSNLAKRLGLNNVFFLGYIDDKDLPAFYKLSKAFVFPSIDRSEAFGVSLLEAASFSKPMISTELSSGTSYVNKHQETGFVVPPRDIEALRTAMLMLSENDELCSQFGKNARKRYERKFTPEITGKKYLNLYNDILSLK